MTLTEEQLRNAALACVSNALLRYKEACILSQHCLYGGAIAFTVIGMEEFAKFITLTVAIFRPDERELLYRALDPRKRGGLFDHKVKHRIMDIVEYVAIEEVPIEYVPTDSEHVEEVFLELTRKGLSELIPDDCIQKARKHAQRLQDLDGRDKSQTDRSPWMLKQVPARMAGLKEQGLYVEIDDQGNIQMPFQLGAQDAQRQIDGLEWFLDMFDLLPKGLADDHQWQRFASTIRSRMAAERERSP